MALRAALVDVGGTLWPDRWPPSSNAVYRRALRQALPNAADGALDRLLAELQARDPGASDALPLTQNTRDAVVEALEAAGLDASSAEHVLGAMTIPARDVIKPFPDAQSLLKTIKQLRLACVIVSNTTYRTASAYARDFADFSLHNYVDAIISSAELGYRKPSQQIFLAAADAARCVPSDCVALGDSEEKDIEPAARLRMRTIRVAIEVPAPSSSAADFVATSLRDAADALRAVTND